eukprot:1521687-Rhodomonas_salina.2
MPVDCRDLRAMGNHWRGIPTPGYRGLGPEPTSPRRGPEMALSEVKITCITQHGLGSSQYQSICHSLALPSLSGLRPLVKCRSVQFNGVFEAVSISRQFAGK